MRCGLGGLKRPDISGVYQLATPRYGGTGMCGGVAETRTRNITNYPLQ